MPRWSGIANSARRTVFCAIFVLTAVPLELALGFLAYLLRGEPIRGARLRARLATSSRGWSAPIANGVMWHYLFNNQIGLIDFALAWIGLGTASSASVHGLHAFRRSLL